MPVNFNFTEDYILENSVALLRPLRYNDYENLLPFAINEPTLWKYSLIQAAGEDGLRNYMNIALEAKQSQKEYPFIVFDKRKNQYAGSTRFYDINLPYQTLQLGYTWYGKEFQGTGLNKHCKYLLLQFAFEEMNMIRVEFRADALNERSIAAMKSIGCKVDGILRSNMPNAYNGRRDSIVLSILKDEWVNDVKEKLKEKLQ
ncbi:MAG TPA: GNAT family protein [Chitinophagaceae bacterium]|nr:GNAT family protein [Chitinophagaceae bacterium]